jgi:hypothetical protein
MAVDPGTHTGVAWAVLGAKGTIAARLSAALSPVKSETLTGLYTQQAAWLFRLYEKILRDVEKKGGDITLEVAVEDYILTRFDSSDREGLDPVRVTSAFTMLLVMDPYAPTIQLQQAGDAMGYATNDRLRHWGVWVPGSQREHERDARRHLLLCAARDILRNTEGKPKEGKGSSGS